VAGPARLSKLVGRSKALEVLLAGRELKALDALRLGVVDHLSAPGQGSPSESPRGFVFSHGNLVPPSRRSSEL